MNKHERLSKWIDSLEEDTKDEVLFQLINRLIETEEIAFNRDIMDAPYWDTTGEAIDKI